MALVVISIDTEQFPPHTKEEFAEWVKYKVGHSGQINSNNPLEDIDIDAYVREISP